MQEHPVENSNNQPVSDVPPRTHVVVSEASDVHAAHADNFERIRHTTAWVMIVSAVLFALIGISAIWEVFGPNTGDVVWRAFSSLGIIAFAALIVNVAARTVENRR